LPLSGFSAGKRIDTLDLMRDKILKKLKASAIRHYQTVKCPKVGLACTHLRISQAFFQRYVQVHQVHQMW
jgi:hypothetical protein